MIEVPGGGIANRPHFLTARISGLNYGGTITKASVTLSYLRSGKPFGNSTRLPVDSATTTALLNAIQTGSGAGRITEFAMRLARKTYCRSGPITKTQGIRRFSDPSDIAKIVEASKRNNGRDTIPAGLKGASVDATRYDASFGTPKWTVSLDCNSPNPYGA